MDPDLYDLMSAWLGRELEPARGEELLARVRRDAEFRQAFVVEIRTLGMLKAVQLPEPRWLRLEDELGWSAAEPLTGKTLEDRVVRRLQDLPRPRPRIRRRWWAAAAALLLVLGAVPILWPRGPDAVPVAPAPVTAARPYPKVDTVDGLAMMLKLDGVRWEPTSDPVPSEGDVLAPGRFRIRSGRATLSMLTGVVLEVEGPADVELISDDKVRCRRGRLRVRVPAGVEGFVVSGVGSAVMDLGTEFGLNMDPEGKARAKVFKGKAMAAVTGSGGIAQRTQQLKESDAFEIDPWASHIELIKGAEDFLAPGRISVPPLVLGIDYPDAIQRSRPWGYWRLDSMSDGAVPNEIPGRPPLRAVGPVRLVGKPGGNRSAQFRPVEEPQNLAMEGTWQPTWQPGFAVELWCLSEAISHATLAGLVNPNDNNHHITLLELTSRNGLHKPASVRLLHRWPPSGLGGDNSYSQDHYIPYRWHHVVGQINGDQMELFVNGEHTSSISITPDHSDLPCLFLLGRLTTRPGSGISIDRPFVGQIDEVALFDHPLSPGEIRDHYRRGHR